MRGFIHFGVVAALALGGIGLAGCESNMDSGTPSGQRSGVAGGNGEFGETPAKAGQYHADSPSAQPAGQSTSSPNGGNAGGNGEFGESPARSGQTSGGANVPTTQPGSLR